MNRRTFLKTVPALAMLTPAAASLAQNKAPSANSAQELQPINLPKPQADGGKSVLAALQERRTNRSIRPDKLPPQMLSNLLWAAFGVNREKGNFGKPGRTAASASNSQEIDLYVALPDGVYLYEAAAHRLTPVVAGDFRTRSGRAPPPRPRSTSSTWSIWPAMSWKAIRIAASTIRRFRSPTTTVPSV